MNILPIQFTPQKNTTSNFGSRKISIEKITQSASDVVDFSTKKKKQLPPRMELTEIEQKFNEIFMALHQINSNIHTQKQMLRSYYSPQDKYDYQELLKTRHNIVTKLKRMATTYGVNQLEIESSISTKKTYNRYAPKILRCQTLEDLQNVKELISTRVIYPSEKALLEKLITQRSQEL